LGLVQPFAEFLLALASLLVRVSLALSPFLLFFLSVDSEVDSVLKKRSADPVLGFASASSELSSPKNWDSVDEWEGPGERGL